MILFGIFLWAIVDGHHLVAVLLIMNYALSD